jgi:hypothetical protein
MKSRNIFYLVRAIVFLIIICTQVSCNQNRNQNRIVFNDTEIWAFKQIRDKGSADLIDTINGKNKRVLSGQSISALLLKNITPEIPNLNLTGIVIKNAVIKGDVFLNNSTIPFTLVFLNCNFESAFNANNTIFENMAMFDNCTFNSVDLANSTFRSCFSARKVVFSGYADFASTKFNSQADFTGTEFNNKDKAVSFDGVKAIGDVSFDNATFAGGANFTKAEFESQVCMKKVKFINKSDVAFFSIRISKDLSLDGSYFEGSASFMNSSFGGVSITGAEFVDPNATILFGQISIENNFYLNDSAFMGQVNFYSCNIGQNFYCENTKFNSKKTTVHFFHMTINKDAFFANTSFNGQVAFGDMKIESLLAISKTKFLSEDEIKIFSNQADYFTINETVFNGSVLFKKNTIGSLLLADTQFNSKNGIVDLGDTSVRENIILERTVFKGPIGLEGLRYGKISIRGDSNSTEGLLQLLEQANYSQDAYTTLENSFRKQGYFKQADRVYIELRRRQGKELSSGIAKIWNRFLDLSVGYGKNLHRVIYPIVFFTALGSILFRRKYMIPRGEETKCIRYFPLFYSIDLFLPVINMYWTKDWMPKKECAFLNFWMVVHAIAGWILIPLALAVWMGIIK